ncbi:putative ABC transporter permease subunit [Thiovibrio sp. JS02]
MSIRIDLLQPFRCSFRNRFFPGGRLPLKTVTALAFALGVCLALYLISVKVLGYFHGQNELGIILSLKIFQMAWIILFAMVIFSCMVSAVSTIFLSRDNEIIFAAPLRPAEIYQMRYLTTSVYTAWMMVIFSLPIFAAYGKVFAAGFLYWLLMPAATLATALAATGIGCLATVVLVNLFPARRTKDIILYLSLCFGLFLYLLFRLMRPEDLVNPDKYAHFVEYLSALSTPAGPYLPAAWAANLLSGYLLDRETDWLLFSLLLTTPLALFCLGEMAMTRWFFNGFSKAQESFGGYRRFSSGIETGGRPWQWIFRKEAKIFLRDSAEWSQLFMIAALIIVYLYNFKMLPLERSYIAEEFLVNIISFLNIGLTGFMVASLAARFVFPAVSSEGGSFYLIKSAPLSIQRFLLYKYLFYLIPFALFTLLLILASNRLLRISGPMAWLSVGTSLLLTASVVAMALGFGAIHADFKAENRASTLGGMGVILFLLTAMSVELAIVLVGAMPAYRVVRRWLAGAVLGPKELLLLGAWLVFSILLAGGLAIYFFKKGIRALENPN